MSQEKNTPRRELQQEARREPQQDRRREYPALYEKGVPIVLGLVALAIVALLIVIAAIALGLFPGS